MSATRKEGKGGTDGGGWNRFLFSFSVLDVTQIKCSARVLA